MLLIEAADNEPNGELEEVAMFTTDVLDRPEEKKKARNSIYGYGNFSIYMAKITYQSKLIWLI